MSEITIKNLGSGKILAVSEGDGSARVGQCSPHRSDADRQRWRLIPVGMKHHYQIQHLVTGMVLEVTGQSSEDEAGVGLWEDNGGVHQQWRLIPVGDGGHEYAILNVHSDKSLDLWDGARSDDARLAQMPYWHGMQQRWILTACDAGPVSRAVVTMVRDEAVFLPIWLRYYGQFFAAQDTYVLDHHSIDGSTTTDGGDFVRIPVSHGEYGAAWQRDVIQDYQHELIGRYDVVLYTDVDEIVAPDPRLGALDTYLDGFVDDFVTCQGYEVLHQKDEEPPFDPTKGVLEQRFMWYANPAYSKPLLARVPMVWHGGFHQRIDKKTNNDPNLYLIHLHRMDYGTCLARHRQRVHFPLAQADRDHGWGYQNRITDSTEFCSWFFHDSSGPVPIQPQPIPPWWQKVV